MTNWETGDLGREVPGPTSAVGAVSTDPSCGGEMSQTTEVASEQAKQVASTTAEQGRQLAATAGDSAKEVAAEAKEQASHVAQQVPTQARNLVGDAKAELRGQAQTQTDRLAGGLRDVARQVQALTSGRPDEAGAAADYARQIGGKVAEMAERLESRGFDGVIDEVQDFARRRPGVFLLGAAALGFAAGRVLRGAQAASASSEESEQTRVPDARAQLGRPVTPTVGPEVARPRVDYAGAPIVGEDSGAIIEPALGTSDYIDAPYGQPGRL